MARKQFVETPRQIVERVLRDTQVLIDMSEIEQDERSAAQVAREQARNPWTDPNYNPWDQMTADEKRDAYCQEFAIY